MDLQFYDLIVVNTSAGKDSLAMLDYVHTMAEVAQAVASGENTGEMTSWNM